MTHRARGAPAGRDGHETTQDDPWGRPVLGAMGVLLILAAISRSDLASMPMLVVGAILVILFAFHSRIRGLLTFGKVGVPITRDPSPAELLADDNQAPALRLYDQATEPRYLRRQQRA